MRTEVGCTKMKLSSNSSGKRKRGVKARYHQHHHTKKELEDPASSSVIQKLYSICRKVFQGPDFVPSPDDVQSLCKTLDQMEPEDVGLSKNLQFFNPRAGNSAHETRRVTSTTIYECKHFSMVLFFIPASGVIPLHNHPDMTVFSKLLFGKMHIKSYDWIADPANTKLTTKQPNINLRLAKLVSNDIFVAPCSTSILYPTAGGNIHSFTAITPCLVLDVLAPPYSEEDDRDCTYYRDFPYYYINAPGIDGSQNMLKVVGDVKLLRVAGDDDDKYGWLKEIAMPEESRMNRIQYMGPPIIEN